MPVADLQVTPEDFEGIVDTVHRQVRGISREDAEEAVSEGWLILQSKADQLDDGPINGWLVRAARFRAMKIRDKAKRVTSLDELEESDVDEGPRFQARADDFDLDSHVRLSELDDNPILRRIREAAEAGVQPVVAPRGAASHRSRYTAEQIEHVRLLLGEGVLTQRQIEDVTGVAQSTVSAIARRKCHVLTTEGWTRELVIEAIRLWHATHERVPTTRDFASDPSLPSEGTLARYFGTYRVAIVAAGLTPPYGTSKRTLRYTDREVTEIIVGFYEREGRWPTALEYRTLRPELPSQSTVYRRFGTLHGPDLAAKAYRMLEELPPDPQPEEVAIVVLSWREEHGRWPNPRHFELHMPYTPVQVERALGVRGGDELGRVVERVLGLSDDEPDTGISPAGKAPPPEILIRWPRLG